MDDELSLIDANIASIGSLALPRTLKSLNLHSNEIARIDGLAHLSVLQHLDLSANRINRIENLDALSVLRSLNLACNNIRRVENLRKLKYLRHLNLSYNALTTLNGVEQTGCDHTVSGSQLEVLEVHGNQLRNFDEVAVVLKRLPNLQHVTLRLDEAGSANPLCDAVPNYRATLFSLLPNLVSVDCMTRNGTSYDRALFIPLDESDTDKRPDLSTLLGQGERERKQYQQQAETAVDQEAPASAAGLLLPIRTPHIDAVLERVRRRGEAAKPKSEHRAARRRPDPDSDSTPESDLDSASDGTPAVRRSASPRRFRSSVSPSRSSSRDSASKPSARSAQRKRGTKQLPATSPKKRSGKAGPARDGAGKAQGNAELVTGYPFGPTSNNAASLSSGAAQRGRVELRTTFERMLNQLTIERDQRAKAQRACRRLVEELVAATRTADNQPQGDADDDPEGDLVQAHRALLTLRAAANERNAQLEASVAECNALRDAVAKRDDALEQMRESGAQLRAELGKQEAAFTKQLAAETRRANEAQARAQALARETDALRAQVEAATRESSDLRSLLMKRENEFEQTLSRRIEPASPEFEKLVEIRERALAERYQRECDALHEKLELSARRYVELEDEFRDALRLEEARYMELQKAHVAVSQQLEEAIGELRTLRERDSRHAETISELSAFAKEARVRLEESAKSKTELVRDYRERNETLEAHLEEATRRVAALEGLRADNASLRSRLLAAESLVDGLRNERKAWSTELARQGTALAQDRGRLDAQVDALTKQLAAETDSVKIKTKIIEDQTDTIQKLKAGLSEKDAEIKRVQREALAVQREAEQRASQAEERCEALLRDMAAARSRKHELKERCVELSAELSAQREKHEEFVARWRNKSTELASLEARVEQLTHEHADRLAGLEAERNDALARLRGVDDAFRKQLDAKEAFHREQIDTMRRERDEAVAAAEERVARAEAEMREILVETERTKRTMEAKLARLQSAVGELFDLGHSGFPHHEASP